MELSRLIKLILDSKGLMDLVGQFSAMDSALFFNEEYIQTLQSPQTSIKRLTRWGGHATDSRSILYVTPIILSRMLGKASASSRWFKQRTGLRKADLYDGPPECAESL